MFNINRFPISDEYKTLCERPTMDTSSLGNVIQDIFEQVKSKKDEALREFTLQFEKRGIDSINYTESEIETLANQTEPLLQQAIRQAYSNIKKFHEAQIIPEKRIETMPGVVCWQKSTAIEKVGIYIPGGTAPLFSTILMLAIPAQIAGCSEIILCTPGTHPALFFAAKLCGITHMSKIGGAQAIAALALGTESIPQVYKIFGPGNQYVTAAKMYANQKGIAIDMPAGPSEVAVFADETANPIYVAADLLSQAEHGSDSQVILISTSEEIIQKTIQEVNSQLDKLPRKDFAIQSLANSKFILVENQEEAVTFLNQYAAEHLILACENSEEIAYQIKNAGSIFLGNYTPEAAGDYASGTNHTLPTNGFARAYSGVNLDSFCKKITLQAISKKGLENLSSSIVTMAEAESLQGHANAIKYRMN
jgi:histidinol dehydrogenase